MPTARCTLYNLAFKLKIVAEAVENNSENAREYGISESMVRRLRKDQANLFNCKLKLSAKRKSMGCFIPEYPELDQRLLEWFSEQQSQGEFLTLFKNIFPADCVTRTSRQYHVTRLFTKPWEWTILIGQL